VPRASACGLGAHPPLKKKKNRFKKEKPRAVQDGSGLGG